MSTITRPRMMRLFLRLPIQSGHNSSTQSSRLVKKLLCRGPGVPGDPGPRPPLIVAGQYLLSRPPAQIDREADVVEGDETMPQQLIFPHQMRQVSPAVPRAGLARAFRIERSEVPAIPGVPEVDAASGGQHSPVAGEAGREHAVEHVHPKAYDLEYPDRVPDAHKVPGLVGGEHGRGEGEGFKDLLPQVGIEAALHDTELRLIPPPVCLFAPPGPARRSPQGLFVVLAAGVSGRTLIQDHRDICPKLLLYLRDQFRREGVK